MGDWKEPIEKGGNNFVIGARIRKDSKYDKMSVNPDFIGIDGIEFYFKEAEAPKGKSKAEVESETT